MEHRRLCIAVDDFGLYDGVCAAALRLADMGRVQAIGSMVGAPQWALWAPRLRSLDTRQVDAGLHLDLTEHPLHLPPRRLGRLMAGAWLRGLNRPAVRVEIAAQLDAFERQMGRAPTYIDGHQHVHQFPVVRDELLAELLHRYPGRLPWLRNTGPTEAANMAMTDRPRTALKPRVIAALGAAALNAAARRTGFRQNAHLLGVHDFSASETDYLRLMRTWLRHCVDSDLLMCHPSLPGNAADPLAAARVNEYRALSGAAFGTLLHAEHLTLQPLSRTLAQEQAPASRAVLAA